MVYHNNKTNFAAKNTEYEYWISNKCYVIVIVSSASCDSLSTCSQMFSFGIPGHFCGSSVSRRRGELADQDVIVQWNRVISVVNISLHHLLVQPKIKQIVCNLFSKNRSDTYSHIFPSKDLCKRFENQERRGQGPEGYPAKPPSHCRLLGHPAPQVVQQNPIYVTPFINCISHRCHTYH